MWYYCECCGAVFPEREIRVEHIENIHWWLDDCPVEQWTEYHCPECDSSDIDEAEYCDCCGDAFNPSDLIDGLCEKCR